MHEPAKAAFVRMRQERAMKHESIVYQFHSIWILLAKVEVFGDGVLCTLILHPPPMLIPPPPPMALVDVGIVIFVAVGLIPVIAIVADPML